MYFRHSTLTYLLVFFLSTPSFVGAQCINTKYLEGLSFRAVGPNRGGRVTAVTGDPRNPGVFYLGSTGGGLWRTQDYGNSWQNVSDGYFSTPSIGAVRIAPSDSKIIYVGTGTDGLRSNIIPGKGVYKSEDEGQSWSFVGLEQAGQIGAVEIDPKNHDRVFVSAIGNAFAPNPERGVYRTIDGGLSWEKVLYLSDTVGSSDLELAPDDANTVYAAMWRAERKPWTIISGGAEGGIYKSTDGGISWKKMTVGLPTSLTGKIDLAVCPADPNILYALIEAPQGEGGLYISTDRGEEFKLVSTKKELLDRPFYYCNVDVNPQNPKSVFVSATRFHHSKDGGKSWTKINTPHGDNHDLWIHPQDTMIWIQGNDGGANVSLNHGRSWSTQFNQPTAELYQVEVDDQFPYWLYAGQQDNYTTIAVPSLPPSGVQAGNNAFIINTGGCETGPAVPKPGDPDIVYANCKGRFGVYNKKTGQEKQYYVGAMNMYGHNPKDLKFRFQRVSPIHISPHNTVVIYHASQYVHKTTDEGQTWEVISPDLTAFDEETQVISGTPITRDITGEEFYSTIYALKESGLKEGLIWAGANDGPIHVTKDGGNNWNNVTPRSLPPGGRVQTIELSSHKEEKAYFATYRYLLGDFKPYIFKTVDYGQSWAYLTDGTNGIPPDCPTRVIREDPKVEGLLYAGTDCGLYISKDDGVCWSPLQNNLPVTPITDIKIHQGDLILSTMGRGFWILDDIQLIQQLGTQAKPQGLLFSVPDTVYRMRYKGNSTKEVPHFPSAGLTLDYYCHEQGPVRMEVYNGNGELVRTLSSGATENKEANEERNMSTEFSLVHSTPKLADSTGAHRVVWDMRHEGPWHKEEKKKGKRGPMVAPGTYRIKLTAQGEELERQVVVMADPRVTREGVTSNEDLKAQEALALATKDLLSATRQLEVGLDSLISRDLVHVNESKELDLQEIKSQLSTKKGRYMTPQLADQINYLYNMLTRADQLPGRDAYERYEELKQHYETLDKAINLLRKE